MQKMKLIKFTYFMCINFIEIKNNNYQYVSKICSKFHIKIMSNKKVTAYQIAISLDFKVAINSLNADMSWDRGGLSSTKKYFSNLKFDSEVSSKSWSIVMLVYKVCSLLSLTQRG